jgi:hypothetical protein
MMLNAHLTRHQSIPPQKTQGGKRKTEQICGLTHWSIADFMNKRGEKTARGGVWTATVVKGSLQMQIESVRTTYARHNFELLVRSSGQECSSQEHSLLHKLCPHASSLPNNTSVHNTSVDYPFLTHSTAPS